MKTDTFRIVPLLQNSVEWHRWRKGKIGASMAPTIMGENPYETQLQLWEKIVYNKETPDNEFMARGRAREPKARDWANNVLAWEFKPVCIESIEYPFLIASLDGLDQEYGKILEIKCPTSSNFDHNKYRAQVQHQMMLTGANVLTLQVCRSDDGEDSEFISIEKDETYCKDLLKSEMEFYRRVVEFDPPEPTEKDFMILESQAGRELEQKYIGICKQLDMLEEHKKLTREQLIAICPHNRCKIGSLKISKFPQKGRVDYGAIEYLKTIDLDKYRKPNTEVWRITSE